MKNQVQNERDSTERDYGPIAARFAGLVESCGAQAVEMIRASKAIGGGTFDGKTAADVITTDVIWILSVISKAKGEVPAEAGRLCQAICGRLNPQRYVPFELHIEAIEDLRKEALAAVLPYTVLSLVAYDQAQGTRLATRAAETYWALVGVACEIMNSELGVAARIVKDKYRQILAPYLSTSGDGGASSKGPSQPASGPDNGISGFGECPECTKSYQALDVRPNATRQEVKTAYRDLAKIFHSDRLQGAEERVQRKADERLKEINLAYGHISSHWTSQEE